MSGFVVCRKMSLVNFLKFIDGNVGEYSNYYLHCSKHGKGYENLTIKNFLMSSKSFYDLDFIIELNERRVGEYLSAFLKVSEQFTVLIIIYSAMAIFLVPIVEMMLAFHSFQSVFGISFILFSIPFLISIYYAVKLIFPRDIPGLKPPFIYYEELRLQYETCKKYSQKNTRIHIEKLLKASYIEELEDALESIMDAYVCKKSYYNWSLIFALLSVLPYLACLGILVSQHGGIFKK